MKIAALILTVYITILTAMPCADAHASDDCRVSFELQEQNPSHSDDVDLCSPFCFCSCCQTLSHPSIYTTSQIHIEGLSLTIPSFIRDEIEFTFSFWHPPKK